MNRNLKQFCDKYLRLENESCRVFFGETLAVMIYVTIGLASIAQYKLAEVTHPSFADPLALFWGYSVGAMFAVLICGKVSGIGYILCI